MTYQEIARNIADAEEREDWDSVREWEEWLVDFTIEHPPCQHLAKREK